VLGFGLCFGVFFGCGSVVDLFLLGVCFVFLWLFGVVLCGVGVVCVFVLWLCGVCL
jgi:hypothetical protein